MKKIILFILIVCGMFVFNPILAEKISDKFSIYYYKGSVSNDTVSLFIKTTYISKCWYRFDSNFGEPFDFYSLKEFTNTNDFVHSTEDKWNSGKKKIAYVYCKQYDDQTNTIIFLIEPDKKEISTEQKPDIVSILSDKLIEKDKQIELLNQQIALLKQIVDVLTKNYK
jgi:hypothetical protein